jgi:hypothetical protein
MVRTFLRFCIWISLGIGILLDNPNLPLPKKLGISFGVMLVLVFIGSLIFDFEKALPSVFKFSIVFVGYYLLASFRQNKSLK